MTVDAVSLFLALLAVLAELTAAAIVVVVVGARISQRLVPVRHALADALGENALGLAFAVAAVAMAGSLYFSEVAHFTPCRLCWYQRICMYPLVPILGLAAWRRDRSVVPYAASVASIGAIIAAYHVLVERFPTLESSVCDPTNPCTLIWVRRLGYLTIPTMALSGFLCIVALLAASHRSANPRFPAASADSTPVT